MIPTTSFLSILASRAVKNPPSGFRPDQLTFLESRIALFQVDSQAVDFSDIMKVEHFGFDITVEPGVDFEHHRIRVLLRVEVGVIMEGEDKTPVPIGIIGTESRFSVHEMEKLMVAREGDVSALPVVVVATALGLAYSTTRGMLITAGAGTLLSKAFLPIVNSTELLRSSKGDLSSRLVKS